MSNAQRRTYSADPSRVEVRDATDEDDGDGLFRIQMPISSTMEARDGEAFTRDRLEGWVRQIESGDVGVFLDHGRNHTTGSRYSALGKLGYWADPTVEDRDGGAELVADAVLMDPAELDADVGELRAALATLRAQAEAGVPLASSVGWTENTGDRDLPGDSDLLEASIVGIPSDPNTTTASADHTALARAVSAAADGFDPEAFTEAYRAITREDVEDATPVAVDGHTPDTQDGRNVDDPAFSAGDAVMWSWQDSMVHGRVADVHEQWTPPEADDPITGEDGEAVYSIHEYDEETEELADEPNVGKPESSLSASTADIPTRMSDDNESDPESDPDREEQALRDMEQKMDDVREMCERMESMQEEMYEEMVGSDGENADGDGGEDEEGGEDDDDEGGKNDAADDETRTVEIDGEERDFEDVKSELRDLREQATEAEPEEAQTDDRANPGDENDESDSGFGYESIED